MQKQAAVNQQNHSTPDSGNKDDHKFSKEESLAASEAFTKFVGEQGRSEDLSGNTQELRFCNTYAV
ncbi:MAG: hypothetical protein IPO72_08860 [Saprospiraceae bacterium]|nr:hypothetical protein [Candidatus Vicinibacter affinis]